MEIKELLHHDNPEIQKIWNNSTCNELGRLAQGFKNRVQFTDCIKFIHYSEVPKGYRPTHARIVAEHRPQKKEEPYRLRITVGSDRVHYPHDKSQPVADLTTIKIHINSTISTKGARYACLDIKNMYLMSSMPKCEYMFIHRSLIPQEFIDEYDLESKFHNDKLYIKIKKGMKECPI